MADEQKQENPLVKFAKGLPVVGALLKGESGGLASSEGGFAAVLVGLIATQCAKDSPNPWIVGALALAVIGVGLYAIARSNAKAIVPLLLAAVVFGSAGCAAIHKGTEAVRGIGTAVFKTTEIIDGAADDVASVWSASGKKATDAVGMTSPAKPDLPPLPATPDR